MEKTAFTIEPPSDTPAYMYQAWVDCLHWAVGDKQVLAHFQRDTGIRYCPPKNGFDALIDQASGYDPAGEFLRAFIPWVNANIWGSMDETNQL